MSRSKAAPKRQGWPRAQMQRGLLETPSPRPLVKTCDHGPSVRLSPHLLGVSGERWIDPFLEANRSNLRRLQISAEVETRGGIALRLTPRAKIGAVPLLSPSTRKVAAGLLIEPRFRWSALGSVLGETGFATEPSVGGSPLVPGSAREVPAWLLAAPVVRRLEAYLRHRKRGFSEKMEMRQSPRGRVDWSRWASRQLASGKWGWLPCHFSEPGDDPELMSVLRWTLARLDDELARFHEASAARLLRSRVSDLQIQVRPGESQRPHREFREAGSGWIADAIQAIGWVAQDRGLGGSRVLDGMSWDLPIDEVWEAWVDAFVAELAPSCGFRPLRRGETLRRLNWSTPTASMRMLIPDSGLKGNNRLIWVDAKYKAHLQLLASRGWSGLDESLKDAHRADLHQALAYAALDEAEHVDSLLVYPRLGSQAHLSPAVATVASGKRRVRLILMGLPFGFTSAEQKEKTMAEWKKVIGGSG